MKTPLVSVIIPVYNGEAFIGEAIASVLAQTYDAIEVIVIDDGSTDSTKAVVAAFLSDVRIKYVHQQNTGLAGARNRGISESTGAYIAFLDADDTYYPHKIASLINAVENDPSITVAAGLSDIYFDNEPEKKYLFVGRPIPEGIIPPERMLALLKEGNCINVNTVLVRRSAFAPSRFFDPVLRTSEDWDLWIRIAQSGATFYFTHEVLVTTRMRRGSLQSGLRIQKKNNMYVFKKNFGHVPLTLCVQYGIAFIADMLPSFFKEQLLARFRSKVKYAPVQQSAQR